MVANNRNNRLYDAAFILYLAVYVMVSLLFLADFPHLSEAEATSGQPLALLLHQISQETSDPFYMRLPGLICSVFILVVLYAFTVYILNFRLCGLLCAVPASLNITFIAAARQSPGILLCLLMIMLLLFFNVVRLRRLLPSHAIVTGLLAGTTCLFSLYVIFVFMGFLSLYLFYIIRTKQSPRLIADYLLAFLLSVFLCLVVKIGLCYVFPLRFPFPLRGSSLLSFEMLFPELAMSASPIAYVPPFQFMAILCGIAVIASLYLILKERNLSVRYSYTALLYMLLGFVPAFFILRSLSPLGFLLLMLPGYPLIPYAVINAPRRATYPILSVLLCFSLTVTAAAVLPFIPEPYSAYRSAITPALQKNDVLLGPYNALFISSSPQNTIFYQDIPDQADTLPVLRRFIAENKITHILFPEEIELIHAAQPRFDTVYGEMPYYSALKQFLENECELIEQFDSSYGMNIARYYWQKKWWVKLYKVDL